MKAKTLYFTAPGQVELRDTSIPPLSQGQVLVETVFSGISPGTEMLVYRGQFPKGLVDAHDPMSSKLEYPMSYGYASVGRVIKLSKGMRHKWLDKMVFSFQPHSSHFVAGLDALFPLPESVTAETACFFPTMETAVNLVQDGAPILGERVLVLGQGVVGLMTTALLAGFPLENLVTTDCYSLRSSESAKLGVSVCLDATQPKLNAEIISALGGKADLTFEVSGSPIALNTAIQNTGFDGRVVIGSWYGVKEATLDLGREFHRSRIKLISSQVSTIASGLSGRWDKTRRFKVAWEALERIQPQKWITHYFPLEAAKEAYHLLDENPQETIQIIFNHKENN
ncbi:MAG: zinc-binding alcohol dehydrogenase [Anaerolineae bacterium]|nr:zinc-binding alcohol dehydrogenase [Anaerolineae bacterium]